MAKRKKTKKPRQTGTTNKKQDRQRQAKKPGKRKAKGTKAIYYEYRANRSDKGKLLGIGHIKMGHFNLQGEIVDVVKTIEVLEGDVKHFTLLSKSKGMALVEKNQYKTILGNRKRQLKALKAYFNTLAKFSS